MRSLYTLRGLTLIDVVVGAALVLIMFVGLFGILRASLQVSGLAKQRATATEIASSQIEYIRSLAYDEVGTVGGIPAGAIPQTASTTNSGIVYDMRTYIAYVDSTADGAGVSDTNGITTDYKVVKVTVSYVAKGVPREILLMSNITPEGLETTTGGGTLRIQVVDATGAALSGATVRIVNDAISPSVDLATFSDSTGIVFLPGAATSTEYQVYVSKEGYSSAETYERDGTNQNPTPGYLTVVAGQTTTSTFAIDTLASLTLRTFSPIGAGMVTDTFANESLIAATSSVQVTGGEVSLAGGPGTYSSSGSVRATATAPAYLTAWTNASSTNAVPSGTTLLLSVVDGSGNLIPDTALPGNSLGFSGAIDLSGISTSTYPSLALRGALTTSDVNVTPALLSWGIGYEAGPVALPNVPVTLTGAKTVGSTISGTALYKTTVGTTTDASGVRTLPLEWDSYELTISGYTLVSSSLEIPFDILPGTAVDASVILTPN